MYVFNLSSGYSGTGFAASLLGQSDDFFAEHEAPPNLFGPWTALWNECGDEPDEHLLKPVRQKMAVVEERRRSSGKPHYADTSHGFIKGWGPAAILLGFVHPENTKLIRTKRNPAEIIRSMVGLRMIPGGAVFPCDHYWLDPHAHSNHIRLSSETVFNTMQHLTSECEDGFIVTQLIQCGWYVLEIEARIKEFRKTRNSFEIFDLDVDQICQRTLGEFFDYCGVAVPDEINCSSTNSKPHLYPVSLELAEQVYDLLCKYVDIPVSGDFVPEKQSC
ncbi:MAG: hypothetical protein GY761_10350 [Hyphomicrobiales bacterium]|nr:hypothetical protein [Hyphomicrobiales bacterium]